MILKNTGFGDFYDLRDGDLTIAPVPGADIHIKTRIGVDSITLTATEAQKVAGILNELADALEDRSMYAEEDLMELEQISSNPAKKATSDGKFFQLYDGRFADRTSIWLVATDTEQKLIHMMCHTTENDPVETGPDTARDMARILTKLAAEVEGAE